jgi:hypothetical protein
MRTTVAWGILWKGGGRVQSDEKAGSRCFQSLPKSFPGLSLPGCFGALSLTRGRMRRTITTVELIPLASFRVSATAEESEKIEAEKRASASRIGPEGCGRYREAKARPIISEPASLDSRKKTPHCFLFPPRRSCVGLQWGMASLKNSVATIAKQIPVGVARTQSSVVRCHLGTQASEVLCDAGMDWSSHCCRLWMTVVVLYQY